MIHKMSRNNTYVVIPNWNGADFISECLRSLQEQSLPHTVIVVDNGSIDDSIAVIEKQFPDVTLLKQPENLGFSGGVNVGIKHAIKHGADYIALLNNDAVADKHWMKNLVAAMQANEHIGIVTSKIMLTDRQHIDSTGDFYSSWGMPFPRGRGEKDSGQFDNTEQVFAASGGASLYSTKLFEDVGFFDEDFFAYFEDVDISFRAQLAGWSIMYEPTSIVYHRLSATSSKLGSFTRYHTGKNFHLLYLKNMPGWLLWKYLPLFTLQSLRLFASNIKNGHGLAYFRGVLSAKRQTIKTLKKRRHIQSNRKANTAYVDSILHHGRNPRPPKL